MFYGKGKMIYNDGRVYEGDFLYDKKNGKGKMTYPNGKVEEGEWNNDDFIK